MAHLSDFEPILPDPLAYVEKVLALYDRTAREKRGRVVFITAEVGGGKTELLSALAKALRQAKPAPEFIAGFFRGGEYNHYQLAWQRTICLNKAAIAAGELGSFLGLLPITFASAANFIGQLLQTSGSAREFADEFREKPPTAKGSADWLRKILRRAAEEKPLVCLLDDWDEAQRFYWDSMLVSIAKEIAQDVPLLLFVTVNEPVRAGTPEEDGSDLMAVIRSLTGKGLAEWWPLRKLSADEVATAIGRAAPGIANKLHGVTGGNARWVKELWREWRLSETVVTDETDRWVWGEKHKATVNLYDDILRDRLTRLLDAEAVVEVEEVRDVLACAALEGERFTADAVARAVGWDRDELIDFFDEVLVRTEDNLDGLLSEEDCISIPASDGTTHTLWRYSFVSDLHRMALERYGFADEQRPGKGDTEKREMSAALAEALVEVYTPEERLVAGPLARLLRDIGQKETADHYQRMSEYAADRALMREQAMHLLSLDKGDWEQWECQRTAEFLIVAGQAMFNAFPYNEALAVCEEAAHLASRTREKRTVAEAYYLCGFILYAGGQHEAAKTRGMDSLRIFRLIRNKYWEAASLLLLANIEEREGRYDEARELAAQALKIMREVGDRHGEALSLRLLAHIDEHLGQYDEARQLSAQALKISQKIRDRHGEGASLHLQARIGKCEDRHSEVRELAAQALNIAQEVGDRHGERASLYLLAHINEHQGRYREMRELATQALNIAQAIGDQNGKASSLNQLGTVAVNVGRLQEAFDLKTLGALILTQIGHADAQIVTKELEALAAEQKYTEEQKQNLFQRVSEAYQKDAGKELIGHALAILQKDTG